MQTYIYKCTDILYTDRDTEIDIETDLKIELFNQDRGNRDTGIDIQTHIYRYRHTDRCR